MFFVKDGKHISLKKIIVSMFNPELDLYKAIILSKVRNSLKYEDLKVRTFTKKDDLLIRGSVSNLPIIDIIKPVMSKGYRRTIYKYTEDVILLEYLDINTGLRVQSLFDREFYSENKILVEKSYPHYNKYVKSFYIKTTYNGKAVLIHHLILDYKGVGVVDHLDRVCSNNTACNLRLVTHKVNMENKNIYKNNKTGVKGIHECGSRYRVTWAENNKKRSKSFGFKYSDKTKAFESAVVFRKNIERVKYK